MNALGSFKRLVAVAGIAAALVIGITAVVLVPGSTLAQAGGSGQATLPPPQTAPPLPPPALHINSPAATPEPGAAEEASGAQAGRSDVEAVRFRPKVRLQLGQPPVSSRVADKPAAGVKESPRDQSLGPEAYTPPDYERMLGTLDWNQLLYEGFEGSFPEDWGWQLLDMSFDGYERLWDDTYREYQYGSWSAWPADGGADSVDPASGYPNDLDSWMVQGPFDLSNMADVFVGFGLWYDTEPDYDWVYFCAATEWPYFDCDYWSGYSWDWTDQAYWLTSYAGYSEVWLAWIFYSDYSIGGPEGYMGPYVDEIEIWGYDISATPTPTPTPDPGGQLIQNGSFETGDLTNWSSYSSSGMSALGDGERLDPSFRPSAGQTSASGDVSLADDGIGITEVDVTDVTAVEGQYSAYLWQDGTGEDFLYQTFDMPAGVTDIVLNYWFAVTTNETGVGRDFFCASLTSPDLNTMWVDLGCVDSNDATGYWQEVVYTLSSGEVAQVEGQAVALVFELYNTGETGTGTAGWVDYVSVYATGGGAGGYIDPHEPNDDYASATSIACSQVISGVIGDAMGGYDVDWFVLSNVPEGQIDIDIAADTQVPPSALDSIVSLWDSGLSEVAWNDDDGVSYDSYIVYTNTVNNATFYISVESFYGYGSADSFYDLEVQCEGGGSGPPPGGSEPEPPDEDTWTVMLYLNAEDPNFESVLKGYRTAIEAFIGSKSFLSVTILYDGPSGSSDPGTTRYLVQPNGNYTVGTNQWDRGELNMGHPDTLANFVSWAMDRYPAENYYLAVDDHGDGAYGISFDPTSNNDQLTPPELYSALKSATHNGARKIDILDYEACLMGLAENAYDLREWVDYVVFSEQISWGINTYPLYFSDLAAEDTPLEVGQRIVERYHAEALAANNDRGLPHTISLIDTSQMAALNSAVTDFGGAIMATDTQAQKDEANDARDDSQAFAADYDATNPMRAEYIDLWDLADEASARNLAPAQAAIVKSAVQAAVIHERHASGGAESYIWDHSGAHGLAIYYPPSRSSSAFDNYIAPSLYQMSLDGGWDEFLDWAVPSGNRRGMFACRSQDRLAGDRDAFAYRYVYLPVVIK